MTVTKAKIVDDIQDVLGFSKKEGVDVVENLLEIMKRTLEKGEDVLISGFGKFQIRQKRQRKGRNPATGEDIILDPRQVVTFKCSGKLRNKVNKGK
jgi:integration host factor subunit alpha